MTADTEMELQHKSPGRWSLAIIGGEVSPRATGLVMEWAAQHREDLLQAWDQARRMETLDRIDPLR